METKPEIQYKFDEELSKLCPHQLDILSEESKVLLFLDWRGYLYEKDGAIWFESSKHGDDKDRVVIKKSTP